MCGFAVMFISYLKEPVWIVYSLFYCSLQFITGRARIASVSRIANTFFTRWSIIILTTHHLAWKKYISTHHTSTGNNTAAVTKARWLTIFNQLRIFFSKPSRRNYFSRRYYFRYWHIAGFTVDQLNKNPCDVFCWRKADLVSAIAQSLWILKPYYN